MVFDAPAIVGRARAAFASGKTRSLQWRRSQLAGIKRMVEENMDTFTAALKSDLGSNDFFAKGIELQVILNECNDALENVGTWSKPTKVSTPLLSQPALSYLVPEPFGVSLIIGAGNYPLSLVLSPLVAAVTAGNVAVVKPSEISVACERVIAELLPRYVDNDAIIVATGAVEETTALLREKYDIIMYTGNSFVARIVMRAAAEHLTPVILELGGKCPAIVAPDADVDKTAKRVAWGKWTMNMGQTCLSPDYVITTPEKRDSVVQAMLRTLKDFYGPDPSTSPDVSRMINERYVKRVSGLLDDDSIEIVAGGQVDAKSRYIAPTVVLADPTSKCMQEEVFGPILPIVTLPSMRDIIEFVNSRHKPLALYVFTASSATAELVHRSTSSGGVCVNDVIMHAANPNLPFGGVGESGMGSYHGEFGFKAFSHMKPVLYKYGSDPSLRFPPYTPRKLWLMQLLNTHIDKRLMMLVMFALAALVVVYIYRRFIML